MGGWLHASHRREMISSLQARALQFSSASKEILESYGNAAAVFAMSAAQINAELSVQTIGMETRRNLLEIALWWKTGLDSQAVKFIIDKSNKDSG